VPRFCNFAFICSHFFVFEELLCHIWKIIYDIFGDVAFNQVSRLNWAESVLVLPLMAELQRWPVLHRPDGAQRSWACLTWVIAYLLWATCGQNIINWLKHGLQQVLWWQSVLWRPEIIQICLSVAWVGSAILFLSQQSHLRPHKTEYVGHVYAQHFVYYLCICFQSVSLLWFHIFTLTSFSLSSLYYCSTAALYFWDMTFTDVEIMKIIMPTVPYVIHSVIVITTEQNDRMYNA